MSTQQHLARLIDELPAPERVEPFAFLEDERLPLTSRSSSRLPSYSRASRPLGVLAGPGTDQERPACRPQSITSSPGSFRWASMAAAFAGARYRSRRCSSSSASSPPSLALLGGALLGAIGVAAILAIGNLAVETAKHLL